MKKSRYHFSPYLIATIFFISGAVAERDQSSLESCSIAQEYYQVVKSKRNDNSLNHSFDHNLMMRAAACTRRSGNILAAMEQYRYVSNHKSSDPQAWSELVFLQMEHLVATLKGIIQNSPPGSEEERLLVEQMMALVETYSEPNAAITGNKFENNLDNLWSKIALDLTWINEFSVPEVEKEIDHYLSDPNYFNGISRRALKYLNFITATVRERKLPIELALIPIVESSLDPSAISPRRAAGLWQLMPSTSRQYQMTRNRWYDERLDIRVSTKIALDHLEKLNEKFDGDWLLTLSAYNSGSSRMQRILSKESKSSLQWIQLIPRETKQYLARVFAISSILTDPDKYGVTLPPINSSDTFVVVETDGRIELPLAATLANMELSTLRTYNPGYLRWATPKRGYQELLLPLKNAKSFEKNLLALRKEDRMTGETYTVMSGDSLITIANRFEVKLSLLRLVNNVRDNMIWSGEKLLIPGTSYRP